MMRKAKSIFKGRERKVLIEDNECKGFRMKGMVVTSFVLAFKLKIDYKEKFIGFYLYLNMAYDE